MGTLHFQNPLCDLTSLSSRLGCYCFACRNSYIPLLNAHILEPPDVHARCHCRGRSQCCLHVPLLEKERAGALEECSFLSVKIGVQGLRLGFRHGRASCLGFAGPAHQFQKVRSGQAARPRNGRSPLIGPTASTHVQIMAPGFQVYRSSSPQSCTT